jgi:hypothetical protein
VLVCSGRYKDEATETPKYKRKHATFPLNNRDNFFLRSATAHSPPPENFPPRVASLVFLFERFACMVGMYWILHIAVAIGIDNIIGIIHLHSSDLMVGLD